MGGTQWYIHLSREEGADTDHIKDVLQTLRKNCDTAGVNLVLGFGPSFLPEICATAAGKASHPDNFEPYETFVSSDGSGKEAKGTQEDLLIWVNSDKKVQRTFLATLLTLPYYVMRGRMTAGRCNGMPATRSKDT